ncbi:hypothetical protein [Pandoraea cepalis]|nr:hypothetical protein [Pandoraea cepalis]
MIDGSCVVLIAEFRGGETIGKDAQDSEPAIHRQIKYQNAGHSILE